MPPYSIIEQNCVSMLYHKATLPRRYALYTADQLRLPPIVPPSSHWANLPPSATKWSSCASISTLLWILQSPAWFIFAQPLHYTYFVYTLCKKNDGVVQSFPKYVLVPSIGSYWVWAVTAWVYVCPTLAPHRVMLQNKYFFTGASWKNQFWIWFRLWTYTFWGKFSCLFCIISSFIEELKQKAFGGFKAGEIQRELKTTDDVLEKLKRKGLIKVSIV